MRNSILILSVLGLTACGSVGDKNVSACEDWLASMSCGDTDFSTLVSCDVYQDTTCDVSDYFTCLTDGTTCDEATGVADMTGWADCATLATCG